MTAPNAGIVVAIADDFLSAFADIPRKQQAKVIQFINKFRANPRSPGVNYEKIGQARDPNLRSVRIDQTYRGIALAPDQGNVYVLLWVDHHDKAYKWAANKICNIHPETGSLQVIAVKEESAPEKTKNKKQPAGLFDGIRDRHLTGLGLPEMLLPLVRTLRNEDDLDRHAKDFPQEAAEALYMLAAGYTLEEVHRELEKPEQPAEVDTSDFAVALANPDSQRRFYVVDNEKELEEMLHAPLEKWRVFLHPSQRKLVENAWNGPVRVLGGAGTGKTVVALHRAKWLATQVFNGRSDRILFTTFTRNLAADIRENLKKICPKEAMRRIEVVNLDKWVSNYLRRNGYKHKIGYDKSTRKHWDKALTLAPDGMGRDEVFYRDEWERVIQPQSVETLEQYKKASRVGRGVRLNRKAREAVWPVFEEYRILLNDAGLREAVDAIRDARRLIVRKKERLPYRAVLVDEAQDMGMQAFRLVRALLPETEENPSLFIVGDAHQRIYNKKVVLSRCGINIRGRGRKLRLNYRTTEETRKWAVALLEGVSVDDLDGGQDEQKGYRSLMHGNAPQVQNYASFQEEVDVIVNHLEKQGDDLKNTCLVVRTNSLVDQYEAALQGAGVQTYRIRRTQPEDRNSEGVRLATMHRVKGLEFETIIIAGVCKGTVPLEYQDRRTHDAACQIELDTQERALLHVAVTRAKRAVLVTYHGEASPFLVSPSA